jgi:hypothetical protein
MMLACTIVLDMRNFMGALSQRMQWDVIYYVRIVIIIPETKTQNQEISSSITPKK